MKLLFLIWLLVKLVTCLSKKNTCPGQQSYFLRVLKNKLFKHSNIIQYNDVYNTKCLAICNFDERCDSINYNDASKTCVLHLDVEEGSSNDDVMFSDENGWTYYEKKKDFKENAVSRFDFKLGVSFTCLYYTFAIRIFS